MLSIVITYHDEGLEFLTECLTQIRTTIDVDEYEIVVVDDCSTKPLPPIAGVKLIRNIRNVGVGISFDVGIAVAKYENVIWMACDMRFIANQWASKLVNEINMYPKALTCTACVGINKDNMDFEKRRLVQRCYGATILVFHDKKSNPVQSETFRGIIEAKWQLLDRTSVDKSYELPCILGACYGVKKSWYQYLDGFWGHKKWGTLEPYISLKSWLFGGSCRIAPHIETAHIFKLTGTHGTQQDQLLFNKMLVATLLFEDGKRLIDFLGTNSIVVRAKKLFTDIEQDILAKQREYKAKTVLDIKDFCTRFKIDLRCE
jgi:glycosyltransferase involved in cell wall biosynthesis